MRIIWKYLKPFRYGLLLAMVLAAVAQVLALFDPVIFGRIIDQFAVNPGNRPAAELMPRAMKWLALAVGVNAGARLFQALGDYATRLVVQKFGMAVFNDGLRQTLRLPYQEFEEASSGHVLSILGSVRRDNEKFIASFIGVLFSSLVGIAFLVWYAVTKSWALVPVFIVGVAVLGGLTGLLSGRIRSIQRRVVGETSKMSGAITESLRNIELVRSMGLTYPEIRRLKGFTRRIYDLEMSKVRRIRTLSFLQGAALLLLKESILFALLWLIFHGRLSPGELITMQFISSRIIFPLQDLGNVLLVYREAQASLQLFDELMAKEPEQRPEEPLEVGPVASLRFDRVSFRYRSGRQDAIRDLSFQARRGETIAFVGPSGSGKSTLVKLLAGLYAPTGGSIYFDDVPARDIRLNRLRRQLGFVTQETQLFSGTIRENMCFAKPDAGDGEIRAALEQASALKLVDESPAGLDTLLGEDGKKLSGGEKQRLAIARALLRDPRILIFDEATSSLDSLTEEEITQTLRRITSAQRPITILIAHRLSTVMHADRIHVLEKGRIVEAGTHAALVRRKGLYYAMWRQQVGERTAHEDKEPGGRPTANDAR